MSTAAVSAFRHVFPSSIPACPVGSDHALDHADGARRADTLLLAKLVTVARRFWGIRPEPSRKLDVVARVRRPGRLPATAGLVDPAFPVSL